MDLAALTEPSRAVGAECVTFQMALCLESLEPLSGAERKARGSWLSPVSPHPAEASAPLNSSTLKPFCSTQLLAPLGMTPYCSVWLFTLFFPLDGQPQEGRDFSPVSGTQLVLNKFLLNEWMNGFYCAMGPEIQIPLLSILPQVPSVRVL